MIHELIGIHNHRVKLVKGKDEIVLSPDQDEFFKANMHLNYGDLANNLNELINSFKDKSKSQAKVESIEDMQRFMENYPEFKRASGNVNKHVSIMAELKKFVATQHLFDVSEHEQEIATKSAKSDHIKRLTEVLENPDIDGFAKVKLAAIFALRYEGEVDMQKYYQMMKKPEFGGVKQEYIDYIDCIL